jgi:hypothetical protein
MSIETRTRQSDDDILPEGREADANQHVPSQVAYDKKVPDNPDDDALPLDGSLTLSDTEPEDQSQRQATEPHLLSGSDSTATANADPTIGQDATGGN